jgi:lon-related putative ATP-dependent protease
MIEKMKLKPERLTSRCNIESLDFETTADLKPLKGIIGQERAAKALEFSLNIKKKGYNVYISGLSGTGRNSYARAITEAHAKEMKAPDDWVYVFNFSTPDKPTALSLERGTAKEFKKDLEEVIEKLLEEIPNVFSGTDYETQKSEIHQQYQQQHKEIIQQLNKIAEDHGFVFRETEQGLVTAPLSDGKPMSQEEYDNLTTEEIQELRQKSEELNLDTIDLFNELRRIEDNAREEIKKLEKRVSYYVINEYIKDLIRQYGKREKIVDYLNSLEQDILENLKQFKNGKSKGGQSPQEMLLSQMKPKSNFMNRYQVNLFIDNEKKEHAPMIQETNPSYYNLLGSIEYKNEMGALRTDFTQIKPGSLHQANGGFLIIQAREILTEPFAWQILKRSLKTGEINIENMGKQWGQVVTSSIKPEPIPLDIKVILIGDPYIYRMLFSYDEDFKKLFKVMSDFDVEMDRTQDHIMKMASFISSHCEEQDLLDFDKYAVKRVIEYSSRIADHQKKLSSRFNQIVEILYEADAWAAADNASHVKEKHVEKAIQEKIYRNSKYEEKLNEMFEEGTLLIDVEGKKIGQINGLAVMGTGEHSFGRPSRITASTYKGKSGIINVEREVKQSGSIHDKGVLILSGYLGSKFAQKNPMALSVSISFEQTYSPIDGDSASSTELYAILSSIADIPLKQGIAVTGSVNQKGEIQPIGGVNEKIEGFYDVCKIKGLTGEQGVMIPDKNVRNLMLKEEVIDAVKDGKFHIYAINHVDEGIEILTDIPAGECDEECNYPEGTIYQKVAEKLKRVHEEDTNNKQDSEEKGKRERLKEAQEQKDENQKSIEL